MGGGGISLLITCVSARKGGVAQEYFWGGGETDGIQL